MKTKMKKLKSVTVEELRVINENSIKANFNRTLDIDGLVKNGVLSDIKHFAYNVQYCVFNENQDGSLVMRVFIATNAGFQPIIIDMTPKDYNNLFQMKFRVVA